MRTLLVIIALAASPAPSPAPELAVQLSAALDQAHECVPVVMNRRDVEPLIGLIDKRRAPLLEIVSCDSRTEKLRNGYQARSWAAMQCGGAVGRRFRVTLDAHGRLRRLEFLCK